MRLLCAIGQRDGALVVREALACVGGMGGMGGVGGAIDLTLLHVVDDRPRRNVELLRGPLRHMAPERRQAINAAEEASGRAALDEAEAAARDAGAQAPSLVTRLERGVPEQIIVSLARTLNADLIALRPREYPDGFPHIGPPSIGHTARFVVDHAPCPVLLLRAMLAG